ncbi:hypothetical protein J3369_19740 [Alteromonas sp. NFXS44]|uniref:EamA family transporter n=1 Tax=Alteromonas sp. NFXS44 TaxID=2818435 RepID=UPI0032DFC3CB
MDHIKNEKSIFIAVLFCFAFVVLSASREVYSVSLLQEESLNMEYLIAVCFIVTTCFANAILLASKSTTYGTNSLLTIEKKSILPLLILNLTTLVTWWFTFYSLTILDATSFSSISIGLLPLCTIIINHFLFGFIVSTKVYFFSVLIVIGVIVTSVNQLLALKNVDDIDVFLGLATAVLVACFGAANNIFSFQLNQLGFSAASVFANRFWLTLIVVVPYSYLQGFFELSNDSNLLKASLLGFMGVSLPIFFLHYSVKSLGPKSVAYLISTIPVFVFILETIRTNFIFNYNIVGVLVISFSVYKLLQKKG